MSDQSTKDTILDAAQQLYSLQGFASTSLRAIIKEAGVNTAAIHYHFGSREGLIQAVLERHAEPVNRQRLELLDALEAKCADGDLPAERVIRAFMEPVLNLLKDPSYDHTFPRLMGHAIMESGTTLRPIVGRIFRHVIERFVPAFQRALPGITPDEVMWRVHFMLGAMVFTLNVPRVSHHEDNEEPAASPIDDAFERLVAFIAAGMNAPQSARAGKETS